MSAFSRLLFQSFPEGKPSGLWSHCAEIRAFTVSVGQQQHQAVQTRVRHLGNVGGTAANGLNSGGCKRLVLALHVGLQGRVGGGVCGVGRGWRGGGGENQKERREKQNIQSLKQEAQRRR